MTVFGYSTEGFLELEPDEVAAAILPRLREVAAGTQYGQINEWNVLNEARAAHGSSAALKVAEGYQWLRSRGYVVSSPDALGWEALAPGLQGVDLTINIADEHALGLLRAARLDPTLAAQVLPAFRRGQYDLAVLAAFREVEDRIRHDGRLPTRYGADLIDAAFGPGGTLRDPALSSPTANARRDMFRGAFGVHRNATGHSPIDYSDPQEAAEAILLGNNLLRHLARAERATRGRGRPRNRPRRTP